MKALQEQKAQDKKGKSNLVSLPAIPSAGWGKFPSQDIPALFNSHGHYICTFYFNNGWFLYDGLREHTQKGSGVVFSSGPFTEPPGGATHRNLTSVAKLHLGRDFDIHNSPLEEKILLSPHLGK